MIRMNYTKLKTLRSGLALLIVLLAVLATFSAAYAAWVTINTNNGLVDTWGVSNLIYTSTCSNGGINDQDEIRNAWVGNDATYFYFGIETCAGPALSDTNKRGFGGIDCNDDGDVTDPQVTGPDGDRLFTYKPFAPEGGAVWDGLFKQLGAFSDGTLFERMGTDNKFIEMKLNYTNPCPGPSCYIYPACQGGSPIRLLAGTADITIPGAVDLSPLVRWNVPTTIRLQSFAAYSDSWDSPLTLAALSLTATLAATVLFIVRRRLGSN